MSSFPSTRLHKSSHLTTNLVMENLGEDPGKLRVHLFPVKIVRSKGVMGTPVGQPIDHSHRPNASLEPNAKDARNDTGTSVVKPPPQLSGVLRCGVHPRRGQDSRIRDD